MQTKIYLCTAVCTLLLSGCATNTSGVSPSQNSNLHAVSPSGTAASEGGTMQRSLDSWLKEEWSPLTAPAVQTVTKPDGTVIQTKTAATEPADETPFTLQKYADKWKMYHENEKKMNEGKPKEASHVESLENMPVIGK